MHAWAWAWADRHAILQEMYYRHLYARCTPDLRQRCESWDNYCDLFGLLLHSNVNMQLPNQWMWDMIDEFIYQFQSFCQYRCVRSSQLLDSIFAQQGMHT